MKSIKAIFRRGQNAKIDGQNLPDNLSRTSSITNLDADQKLGKGAKPRKSASRDKIDKIGDGKKNEKKGITKNNNKLESGESPYPSIDSLQEEEFLQLRRQLQEMAQEKSNLALQLGEQKGQLNILQKEIQSLKSFQEESNLQLEQLTEENTALRNRLRDVAHSPLSDNEKQQLLYETHHRHHSSAPASIATNLIDEGTGGDITACPTPDWDKHSSSNVSEVSVACLQDKINQMQETHYSTNEELQATLQELTDLQRQLTELQQENERLNEEKTLMFDSLCRQTERLNDSRSEVESLKQLLYREKDEAGQYESAIEREQKLVDLLKSAQEEKQTFLLKLEQGNNEIQEARAGIVEKDERITQLSERVRTLESTLDAKHAEHKQLDLELAQAKDQCSGKQIEINRLTDLLDNARTKIVELEQDRALSDKSELDELLDNARKEKDSLESEVAHLKEQLAISKNEIEKLKEQVSILQEECKVTRNNARTKQNDLEYKCEKLISEKNNLNDQLLEFQEAINELQVQSQCQLEDKRQLSAVLSETQRNLSEAERKNVILESELQELKKVRSEEVEEWEKFQNDLLTSVRVANDFKTEAQQDLQRMILENKSLREKERQLKSELEKLKGDKKSKREEPVKPKLAENRNSIDMENLLGLSKRSRDKPRKGKDTVESTPRKHDKHKEKKPEVEQKPVKRRDKPTARSKKTKTLSVEEELLLKSLNDWYENIDKNVPEDKLTEEQKVIKKLKTLYEDDSLKEKPVAHKPKNLLAISKPLLDSVFLNPKLEEIVKDTNMPTIEEMENYEVFSENEVPEYRNLPEIPGRSAGVRSVDFTKLNERKRASILGRSKSCDDLFNLDEKHHSPTLYRSAETEDLRKDVPLVHVQRESSILPSDSVSNPRYSDFAAVVDNHIRQEYIERGQDGVKLTRNSSVNFETLESILSSIPKDVSEDQLNSEQKFAVRLKQALDEAERKNTLKKIRKGKKQVVISSPTADSVEKNAKLKDILLNPGIQSVGGNSEVDNKTEPFFKGPVRQSKSYQDISFSFGVKPNDNKSIDSTHSTLGDSYGFNSKHSQTETFSSAEVDHESNLSFPHKIKNFNTFKENEDGAKSVPNEPDNFKLHVKNQDRDLLYNETLNAKRQSHRNSRPNSMYEARSFTVESFDEDDVGKNHTATVITSEEYVLVLDDLQDRNRLSNISDSKPAKLKVKSLEDAEIDKSRTNTTVKSPRFVVKRVDEDEGRIQSATVTTSETYTAVLDKASCSPKEETPPTFIVKYDEDDIDRSNRATIITAEEHSVVLDEAANMNRLSYSPKEETSQFKVKPVDEDEIDRCYTATVVTTKKHIAVMDETQSNNRHSYSPKEETHHPKIKLVEVDRSHTATVITPEKHTAVLDDNRNSFLYSPKEGRLPQFKVKCLDEDEIDRVRTTTVVAPEEHIAILEDPHFSNSGFRKSPIHFKAKYLDEDEIGRSGVATVNILTQDIAVLQTTEYYEVDKNYCISNSNSAPKDFKVMSVEDTVKNCVATVILPQEHPIVLEDSHQRFDITSEPIMFKVESDEDEVNKSNYTTVIPSQEHLAIVNDPQFKDYEDLTYNETLNRLSHREQPNEKGYGKPTDIPDIIVDVSNTVTSNQESEDSEWYNYAIEEVDTNEKVTDYEEASWNVVDEEKNPEYDYHSILKENRYGVETPLNIRLSYKDVVKEIKNKFSSSNDTGTVHEEDEEDYSIDERDTFFDEFFGTKRKSERTEPDGATSSTTDDIDAEMEEIFKKYLHTPVSKVITRIDNKVDDSEDDGFKESSRKNENIEEVTSATNFAILASERSGAPVLSVGNFEEIIEEENEEDDNEKITPLNNLVEEPANISSKNEDVPDNSLSQDIDKEFVLTEIEKQTPQIVESVNENISLISNVDYAAGSTGKVEIDDTDNTLSEEELSLLRSLENIRYSRPLSDFSDKDLRMIEKLSARYSLEPSQAKRNSDTNKKLIDGNETEEGKVVENNETDENIKDSSNISDNSITPDLENKMDSLTIDETYKKDMEVREDNKNSDLEFSSKDADNEFETIKNEPEEKLISIESTSEIFIVKGEDQILHRIQNVATIVTPKFETDLQETSYPNEKPPLLPRFDESQKIMPTREFENKRSIFSNNSKITMTESKYNDDEDDLTRLLQKISAPSSISKRRVEKPLVRDIELKDGRPKVVLRNTNYEGVKSKLEFFSKRSSETTQLKRQSLNPHSDVVPDRRKVKSWAERFEKRTLDTHITYEPVYANLESLNIQRTNSAASSKIDKKPLPVPRSRNLGGVSVKNHDSSFSDTSNDESVDEVKMSDCKIISETDTENLSQEHPGSDFSKIEGIKVGDIPVYSETSRVMPEGSQKEVEDDENLTSSALGIKKSEKFLEMRSLENAKIKDEPESLATGAESSFSSIAVAGKFEELDITKHADDVEEISTNSESHLNLFHLETPSYDESYLSLFKSPEEKMYEDISGVRKPQKGYFNFAYVGDLSDNESCDEISRRGDKNLEGNVSKPKIIDFVPLDDATKPVFKKDIQGDPVYDTLEREKTFHVLNIAASTGAVRKSTSSMENRSPKVAIPSPSSSRMSFSAAKKVFENLLESNVEANKDREKPVLKSRDSVHKKPSETEVNTSAAAVKKP